VHAQVAGMHRWQACAGGRQQAAGIRLWQAYVGGRHAQVADYHINVSFPNFRISDTLSESLIHFSGSEVLIRS